MIRRAVLNIDALNAGKKRKLLRFMADYTECVQGFIDLFWEQERFAGRFIRKKTYDLVTSSLGASARQLAAQTALQVVKSQRKKIRKTKPTFAGRSVTLDSRFIDVQVGRNSFDTWIRVTGFGDRTSIVMPAKRHKHYNELVSDGFTLRKSARFSRNTDGKLLVDVFLERPVPEVKTEGFELGLDSGLKKALVGSDGSVYGGEILTRIDKISRKKQGSKAFKRALVERNDYIRAEVKKLPWSGLSTIIVEDLRNVKKGTKGKFTKAFNNKLQRWIYSYTLDCLSQRCELAGVQLVRVPPQYTSQRCGKCGDVHKENRNGELFLCTACGYTSDADLNASRNILNRYLSREHMFTAPVGISPSRTVRASLNAWPGQYQ